MSGSTRAIRFRFSSGLSSDKYTLQVSGFFIHEFFNFLGLFF